MDEISIISSLLKIGLGVFVAIGFIKIFENYKLKSKDEFVE